MSSAKANRNFQPGASWVLASNPSLDEAEHLELPEDIALPQSEVDTEAEDVRSIYTDAPKTTYTPPQALQTQQQEQQLVAPIYREPQLIMPTMHESSTSTPRPGQRRGNARSSKINASKTYDSDSESDDQPRPVARARKTRREQPEMKQKKKQQVEASEFLGVLWRILSPILSLSLSVFSLVFSIMKPILTIVLAFWVLSYVASYALHTTLTRTLSPVCNVPAVSQLIPFCSTLKKAGPVEFDQLMTVQSAFEDVLANSAGSQNLPLDMKRSEASIRDLRQVVQYSSLPSRNEMTFELTGFIDTARQAAGDLTRFNSRIGRAVDQVASTNKWTLSVLDGMADAQAAQGTVERFLANTVFSPFQGTRWSQELVLDQYLKHTNAVEEQIAALILEAQALLGILQNLDDRLEVIHSITTRDGVSVRGSRDELFLNLFTYLGANRSNVKKHDEQLLLLGQLSQYRRTAWDHVSGTMLKLQSIAAELEDLRERVAAPDLMRSNTDVPLKMHIEHIQMGLDRLEGQRMEGRLVEGQAQRRVLDRGERLAQEPALLLT